MKKKILSIIFAIPIFAFPALLNCNSYSQSLAEENESITLSLLDSIHNIYNNSLNDVDTNEWFDYGLRHGALNIGDKSGIIPGCYKFDSKGPATKYIYSSDATNFPSFFDWEGGRYNFSGYDGLIFKIVAKKDISIKTSITSETSKGWVDDTQLYYFVSNSYNEDSKNWIGNDCLVKKIELCPTKGAYAQKSEFEQVINLKKGYTFYWEYSWNWYDTRNIELSTMGFKFEIENNSYEPKVVASETYNYLNMIENVASINCNDVTPNLGSITTLTTYGFRHGSVEQGNINKFTEHSPTWLGPRSDDPTIATFMENWRFTSVNGDAAIIYFKAEKDIRLNIERSKFGNDVRERMTLNIYKNDNKIYTKLFDGKNDSVYDFSYSVELNKNDYIYWEIIHYGDGFSIISMGNDGNDQSTLPKFTAIEATDINYEETTLGNVISAFNVVKTNEVTLNNKSAKYSFYKGSFENNSLTDLTIKSTSLEKDGVKVTSSGIALTNDTLTIKVVANINLVVYLDIIPDNFINENFKVKFIRFLNSKQKAKQYLDINFKNANAIGLISDYLILDKDDVIYLEFKSLQGEINFTNINKICFLEKCIGDGIKSSYPIYEPTDYKAKENFTHKEIAFESARLKDEAIETNKFSIQLLTGKVNEENDLTYKFTNIQYEDGQYIGSMENPSMRLTDGNDSFDGDNYAAVEDYRLKTSSVGGVIYKIISKVDTAFEITHPDTTGGWVGQGADTYIGFYQSNGEIIKNIKLMPVENANNPANTFAYTFHLKAGDIAYVSYEENVATQRNLNIAFNFKLNEGSYDPAKREEIFGKLNLEARMEDVITLMMNNNCQPITFAETLEINLAHGKVKDPKQFLRSECEGDGTGSAEDALVNGSDGALLAKFFRWQIRAGVNNDSAIMIFKAHKNMHLKITHPANKDSWSSSSSFKYYYADVDGFLDYKEERFVSSDLDDDYFGYDCHLKAEQSLVIVYSSNDESNFGVVDVCWVAHVTTEDFDESKVNDFTNARAIQAVKDEYQQKLENQIQLLNKNDYSLSNWGKIETYYENYLKNVETLVLEDEIINEYNVASTGISLIKNKAEEAEELKQYKQNTIQEARTYLDNSKDGYTKETLAEAENIFAEFKNSVEHMDSITDIRLAFLTYKSKIDALPHDGLTKGALIGIICGAAGALIIAAGITTFIVIKRKKKVK